jgi:hypothetical protein
MKITPWPLGEHQPVEDVEGPPDVPVVFVRNVYIILLLQTTER